MSSAFYGLGSLTHLLFFDVKAVSQLLWPHKDREVWFSLGENHEKAASFGLHQL
jgi:hypothetical protein